MLRPQLDNFGYDIHESVEDFTAYFKTTMTDAAAGGLISSGYHIVDIPLKGSEPLRLPRHRFVAYLTDLNYPSDLLRMEQRDAGTSSSH